MLDIGSFIILTQETMECYLALGLLHNRYTPVEGQLRDQIANRTRAMGINLCSPR